jgi:hypothetical protein
LNFLAATWIDRDGLRRARRKDPNTDVALYTSTPELVLSPLPAWRELPPDQRRARYEALIVDIEQEAAQRSSPVLGADAVQRQHPHDAPASSARSPAPLCHATSRPMREAFIRAYSVFVGAFRAAAKEAKRRAGQLSQVVFPAGSYPRPRWFVPHDTPPCIADLAFDLEIAAAMERPVQLLAT